MSKSVSNDALWEKLSEVSLQLNYLSAAQKPQDLSSEQAEKSPDLGRIKAEIIAEIEEQGKLLGMHSDINFKANEQNVKVIDENIRRIFNIVSRIRKQQKEAIEPPKTDNGQQSEILETPAKEYFNFRFFKLRKSSLIITVLGLLVFILTLFSMKQQNDYSLLMEEYYRQGIEMREIKVEVDSLRKNTKPDVVVKKNK
jgi:hypothetical protein